MGDGGVVEAWADAYIRHGHRPAWQDDLRGEVKARCRLLEPAPGEVLHATFVGDKPVNADVENLVLYNIDSFTRAGRNGIWFEHGAAVPPAPDGYDYPYFYRYATAPRENAFASWRQGRELVSFEWTNLPQFSGDLKLAHVWLALARSPLLRVGGTWDSRTPFATAVQISGGRGRRSGVTSEMVKAVLDGVICVLQAHTDASILPDVAARVAASLPADAAEIEAHLSDHSRAVIGTVPRLVKPFGAEGVQWSPSDHWCLAGELVSAAAQGAQWAIRGSVFEISRSTPTV